MAELLTRRARRQHDPAAGPQREHAYDSSRYNAWSGKSARNRDRGRDQTRAVTRCDAIADCGRTRGDDRRATTICLHFARGCCSEGDQCEYLHHLPTARDDAALFGDPQALFGAQLFKVDFVGQASVSLEWATLRRIGRHSW